MRTNYNKIISKKIEEPATHINKNINRQEPSDGPIYGIIYNCNRLNVRELDNKESKIICVINNGDKVILLKDEDTDNNFVHIKLEDGTIGYVVCDFVKEV